MRNILSVITLTFNNYNELVGTTNSIRHCENIESVIINGGGCVKTAEFLQKNPRHISVSEPDEGIADAFNKGLNMASGQFIAFLNSGDTLIDEEYYRFAINYFIEYPLIDYIYADILFDHAMIGKHRVKPNKEIGKTPFPHPSLIVRSRVFIEIGGFDNDLKSAMDFDFMCKMIKNKFNGYYYQNNPVVLMDGKGISSSNGLQGLNERELVLKRYNMLDRHSYFYFKRLRFSLFARKVLDKLNILEFYDHFRYSKKK